MAIVPIQTSSTLRGTAVETGDSIAIGRCTVTIVFAASSAVSAYENNDRRDHRGEEHKTAEHSQGDHGSQVQFGLMGAAGMLSVVHSEGTRRFRHARADSRLCVVHALGYLVVLRMLTTGVY